MTPESEQYTNVCKGEFEKLHNNLDEKFSRLDNAIRGNGTPGIYVRIDRLEQFTKALAKGMWIFVVIIAGLIVKDFWPEKPAPVAPTAIHESAPADMDANK